MTLKDATNLNQPGPGSNDKKLVNPPSLRSIITTG